MRRRAASLAPVSAMRIPMRDDPYDLFLIWSIEHDAWWAPGEHGYTREIAAAGIYPRARAAEIVHNANIVRFHECMIPLACVRRRDPYS